MSNAVQMTGALLVFQELQETAEHVLVSNVQMTGAYITCFSGNTGNRRARTAQASLRHPSLL